MVEPCAQAYEALLLREQKNRVIMIDPNIRQSFISDEAAYRARIGRMMAASDLVKVSDEDLAWLTGSDELQKGAKDVLEAGTKIVCVTEGAKGVTAFSAKHSVRVPANKVDVVDTVGAGDTFNAGFMAALSEADVLSKDKIANLDETTIRAALTLGARAAAVTVSRAGANPPTRAEL